MTGVLAFKECDVIPFIPVALFVLIAFSSFKAYDDSTFGIV